MKISESDDPLSSSNVASSIRSSRRRLKSGSAVVLNTHRLQKYIQNSSIDNNESMTTSENEHNNSVIIKSRNDKKHEIFDHLRKLKMQFNEIPVVTENISSSNSPGSNSTFPSLVDEINSVLIIQRKWKQFKNYRFDRFTQFGRWSLRQSNKVFALLLGYRIRYLLKSIEIKMNIKAQRDIIQILSEMCDTSVNKLQSNKTQISKKWDFIQQVIKENNQEFSTNLIIMYTKLTPSDLKLVKSLVKQLLIERLRLHLLMFNLSIWILFPSPGYLDLSMVVRNLVASSKGKAMNDKAHYIFSPVRKVKYSPTKEELVTPPNLRMAINSAMKSASPSAIHYIHHNDNCNIDNQHNKRPLPLKNVFDMKLGQESYSVENVKSLSAMKTPEISHDSRNISSGTKSILSTGSSKKSLPINSLTPKSIKLRNSIRGHIQLNILSADKLMSAKKGSVTVADRIPCLRVKLMLPPWSHNTTSGNKNQFVNNIPQSPESGFKKVYQESRDFTTTTLSPQWNTSFILNLPCTKSIILNILSNHTENLLYTPNQELSDTTYHIICKSLLQWWSQGTIIIEVFDGERFNTDIFMGQFQLLLSGFMVAIKKYDDLDIKGNFQLCKVKPTDRVSGFVKLHAYLHVPTKLFMSELLNIPSSSSIQSNKIINHDLQSDRISKQNLSYDEIINEKSYFEEVNENIQNDSIQEVHEPPQIVYSSKFMKALQSKNKLHQDHYSDHSHHHDDVIINCDNNNNNNNIEQPNLEESENIKFNSKTGIVTRINYNTKQINNSLIKNNVKNDNIITINENAKANKREQSVDSSLMRRYSMVDIAKQLDGLSAVQVSTDEILDNLNLKLKSKGKDQSVKIKNNDISNSDIDNIDLNNKSHQEEIDEDSKLTHNSQLHKSSSTYEDLDYPEMNDNDDNECVNYTSSEDNIQDRDHSYLDKEIYNDNVLVHEEDDDVILVEEEEFNRNSKQVRRDNYLMDNNQMKNIKLTIYKNKTIYHSSPTIEVVHNYYTANDESSIYSSNIQDMSYFDDNNSSSTGINATTDESDELIVLQQSNDNINQQSNISFQDKYNINQGSYVIQTIHNKIQSQVLSGNNNSMEESSPIKRKKHERFPYEIIEDDNDIHRVILELNDLEL